MNLTNKLFGMSLIFFCFSLYAQSAQVLRREFIQENLQGKTNLLQTAQSADEDAYTQLCITALDFINTNYALLFENDDFIRLAQVAAENGIKTNSGALLPFLEKLFTLTNNQKLIKTLLESFSVSETKNQSTINLINSYIAKLFNSTEPNKNELLLAAVQVLGHFNHISSFQVLFNCYVKSSDSALSAGAAAALNNLAGTYEKNIRELILNGNSREKLLVLELVLKNDQNSDFFKAEMSEKALANAIQDIGDVSKIEKDTIALQMSAIRELQRISWTRSAALMVNVFLLSRQEYAAGFLSDAQFIEIIYAFTRLASTEAGAHLSAYLKVLNQAQEENKPCSKPIVLAVIQSLGLLGDKVAFDNLLYATYQAYPDDVLSAARDALVKLKW